MHFSLKVQRGVLLFWSIGLLFFYGDFQAFAQSVPGHEMDAEGAYSAEEAPNPHSTSSMTFFPVSPNVEGRPFSDHNSFVGDKTAFGNSPEISEIQKFVRSSGLTSSPVHLRGWMAAAHSNGIGLTPRQVGTQPHLMLATLRLGPPGPLPRQWTQGEGSNPSPGVLIRYGNLFSDSGSPSKDAESHPYGEINLILNPAVERNIRYFQTVIPDKFQEWLSRFYRYQLMVTEIFQELGLPEDLVYLSVVESGFNPRAYSRARAAGPWQFMKATGRLYGLRVNWYVDERRDPIKSTVAAAQHLRDLYDTFSSWPLALAAYNAGAGKISRAIKKSRSRDFWKIRKTRYIRRETKDYVPKFMAATIIATNPTLFGFSRNYDNPHAYEEVLFQNKVHLRSVAKKTGISHQELRRLNPELRRGVTPPNKGGYYLKVPDGMSTHVETVRDQIQVWTQPPATSRQWYRVRRGDSLSVIASRFGMSVLKLKRLNNLSGNVIRVGDRLQVGEEAPTSRHGQWYRVRRGDSLSVIAQRYGISVGKLKRLNNLSGNFIRVGDRLRVSEEATQEGGVKWYRVRRGDSLWSIAQRFSVTVTDLKALNNLTSSVIRAGRLLLVSP